MTTALPPFVQHSAPPISPRDALSAITTFLEAANNTAAYRPDSTLSERGPVSTSTSGTQNLVLHHLNRIKLGLEGVRVGAAELKAEDAQADAQADEERALKKRKREDFAPQRTPKVVKRDIIPAISATGEDDAEPMVRTTEEQGGEWEEKDNYELAQDDEEVDMNAQRDPAGGLEQPADSQDAADMMEMIETQTGDEAPPAAQVPEKAASTLVLDKEERKRLKKLKQKQEKRTAEGEGKARRKKDKKTANVKITR